MILDLEALRAFSALAEELHFGRAAARLYMSQPTLSRIVQRLEEQIGGGLFVRTRRKVALTEAGRALVPRAAHLLRGSADTIACVRDVIEGRAGTLRIGFGIASVSEVLPRTIRRFRKAFPGVELFFRDMSTAAQIDCLARGDIDLGIVRFSSKPATADGFPLLAERLVLALPRQMPYQPKRGLAGLAGAPFIVLPPTVSTTFNAHVLAVCRRAGFAPNVVQEAAEMFTILNLVRAGLGVSLVPRSASRMRVPGIGYHELHDAAAEWQIGPVWNRNTEKLPLIAHFCEALRAAAEPQRSRSR